MRDETRFALIMYLQFFILVGPALIGWAYYSWRDRKQPVEVKPAILDQPADEHIERAA